MASSKKIVEGLQILQKYTKDDYFLGAEHDIIYVHVPGEATSLEDRDKLEQLGFHVDSDTGSWSVFV